MATRRDKTRGLKVAVIIVAFMSLTALVVFKSGIVDSSLFNSTPAFDKSLISSVSIQGMVKQRDLNLSAHEIKKINLAALKYKGQFERCDFYLNYAAKEGGRGVVGDTVLVMNVKLAVDGGGEVCSWKENVKRKDMIPKMVRYLDKAASELLRFQNSDSPPKVFERIYI